jgi:hypothetical protein
LPTIHESGHLVSFTQHLTHPLAACFPILGDGPGRRPLIREALHVTRYLFHSSLDPHFRIQGYLTSTTPLTLSRLTPSYTFFRPEPNLHLKSFTSTMSLRGPYHPTSAFGTLNPRSPYSTERSLSYITAYPASTPSPSERSFKQQRQYFPLEVSPSIENADGSPIFNNAYEGDEHGQSLVPSTSAYSTQPQISLHGPSMTPHISAPSSPSPRTPVQHKKASRQDWTALESTNGRGNNQAGIRSNSTAQQDSRLGTASIVHRRLPSGSSVDSGSPSSPYSHNSAEPFIAQPDSASFSGHGFDSIYSGLSSADQSAFDFSKGPLDSIPQDSLLAPAFQNYNPRHQNSDGNLAASMAMAQAVMAQHNHGSDDEDPPGLSPAPHRQTAFNRSSRPSVSSLDFQSPATPDMKHEDIESGRQAPSIQIQPSIPKFDRTYSDAAQDELYNPSLSATSAPSSNLNKSPASINTRQLPREGHNEVNRLLSPFRNVFTERIQQAQNEHLTEQTVHSTQSHSRDRSPFRQGSPYYQPANSFGASNAANFYGASSPLREQQSIEASAAALRQQMEAESENQSTPTTISPKDAVLEYHEPEDEAGQVPLFPPDDETDHLNGDGNGLAGALSEDFDDNITEQSFPSMATSRRESSSAYSTSSRGTPGHMNFFAPPSVPGNVQVRMPQQYPFVPQQHQRRPVNISYKQDMTPSLVPSGSSLSEGSAQQSSDVTKPQNVKADSGTYTCTYHGCTLRFDSPAKLQKHKREGHRQAASQLGGMIPPSQRNSQAGPHKCERINPSTGKPCNTIFSRPYDLTRHEDTIHNARKQKVRCHLCTEEKTFSRSDALTRHMRVVHPDVDFPKSRKRHHE